MAIPAFTARCKHWRCAWLRDDFPVGELLGPSREPQVHAPVVERVPVDVVDLQAIARRATHQHPMQPELFLPAVRKMTGASDVAAFGEVPGPASSCRVDLRIYDHAGNDTTGSGDRNHDCV
jgi:hypothetical protein